MWLQVRFKSPLHQGFCEPEFYGDYVYTLKKIVGSNDVSAQFIKIISHYKKIGYDINVMQQTACFVVNPITVGNVAFLFNCMPMAGLQTLWLIYWCFGCCQAQLGLSVGFILLHYSVLCTFNFLS